MESSGLWTQAGLSGPHQLERRRPQGAGRAGEGVELSRVHRPCSNNRYQMIISSRSGGPCSLGGLHLLSSSQPRERKGYPVLSMLGRGLCRAHGSFLG